MVRIKKRRKLPWIGAGAMLVAGIIPVSAQLTNNYATAIAVTEDISSGFDTSATLKLGILAFLLVVSYIIIGLRTGKGR